MSLKKHTLTLLALISHGQRALAEENPSKHAYSLGNEAWEILNPEDNLAWRGDCKTFCNIRVNNKATVKDLFVLHDANIAGTLTTKNLVITGSTSQNGSQTINGNIYLRHTTPNPGSIGSIYKEGILFMHDFGPNLNNVFLGSNAGNLTLTGISNTGIGGGALQSLTTGTRNSAFGLSALANTTTGGSNSAFGSGALFSNTTGFNNTAVGRIALYTSTTGSDNTAIGEEALFSNTSGTENTAIGSVALTNNITGNDNVALGISALSANTTGSDNTALGSYALYNSNGNYNIAIGREAGLNYTSTESGNIIIGSGQTGTTGESGITRIGNVYGAPTAACFIAGISGVTPAGATGTVLIDGSGQLGTISSSRRYKKNITDLEDIRQQFMLLRPVSFAYTSDASEKKQYGLIAEEVESIFPELIVYNKYGEIETIQYHLLYALLIKMIQEQNTLIEQLRSSIQ